MSDLKKIKNALISVYYKDNLEPIILKLRELGVNIYSTGGTQKFIEDIGSTVIPVEQLTSYPSILGGRVKTLHPKIFGGILGRRELQSDLLQLEEYEIPEIDLVIVDLYPFEATVASGAAEQDIIEKIDIGGISLIRAAAKNFKDVLIVSSRDEYPELLDLLNEKNGSTTLEERKQHALNAFHISSNYDSAIFNYFNQGKKNIFKQSIAQAQVLRYGENPHQQGIFYGKMEDLFDKLHGKELSYNNLLDVDAAVALIAEFSPPAPQRGDSPTHNPLDGKSGGNPPPLGEMEGAATFAILKHNNACGIASRTNLTDAWKAALAADPVSAFGGILITNREVDEVTASEINNLFFEVIIAPAYSAPALEILKQKKNRIILVQKPVEFSKKQFRTLLNGVIEQDKDLKTETIADMKTATIKNPTENELSDMEFANKIVKHTKSNTIVLAKNKQLLASGVGQTSRVDALRQAIAKATSFGFDLKGSVMGSDAFFPFPDCVEIAHNAGVTAVLQPGGSVKDQESIDYCNNNGMAMAMTGIRHFKH